MDKIIVECLGNMEFLVDANSLEPLTTTYYDPYPNSILYPKKWPTLSIGEWEKLQSTTSTKL